MKISGFFFLCALGCAKSSSQEHTGAVPSATAVAAPIAASTAASSTAVMVASAAAVEKPDVEVHVLTYASDIANECTDILAYTNGVDAGVGKFDPKKILEGPAKGGTLLKKPCREQMIDRPELASCVVSSEQKNDAGASVRVEVRSGYYNIATLQDDTYMKQCLEMKGDWKALPSDSPEMRAARLKLSAKKADDALKKLEGTQ